MRSKRLFDLFVVSLSLPVTLPVMLGAALMLRIFQGKDVFFKQKRIGKNGKVFELIKFRTMREGAGSDMERATWIGSLLRKLSVDELPEIYNIFKGEMSVVGPRPLPETYRDFFTKEEFARHSTLPGLTGLAQASGRNSFSWKDKFQKDIAYIEKQSLWLDIKIVSQTFLAIFNFGKVNASSNQTMEPLTNRVHIIGAGGHAKAVFETALACGKEVAGVYDSNPELAGKYFYTHKIRPLEELPKGALVVLAVGDNMARKKLSELGLRHACLSHPQANVSPSAILEEGSVVFMGASLQADARVGRHCIINTNASIDHDCHIEDFAHIGPGASLCGGVTIGEASLVGVGASASPLSGLPPFSVLASGSALLSKETKSGLYAGAPAKLKKQNAEKEYSTKEQVMEETVKAFGPKTKKPENKQEPRQVPMAMPDITEEEAMAVAQVVRSKRLALGPNLQEFESQMAEYTGRKHAIAVSSGTAGLHLSLMAMGIGKGDEVLVPSYTFVASVNCILFTGAVPVFVDVDEKTFCVCPEDAKRKIGPKTKAMVCVDVFGHPAPLEELEKLCREHNMRLIDDSCEGLGASYKGKKVGKYGDTAVFAFYPNKQITTGEGGMILTDDDEIARKCRTIMNQGRDSMSQWLEHVELGYNFRMSEIHAAVGRVQMTRLNEILSKREQVAHWYLEALKDAEGIRTQHIAAEAQMSWFVFVVTLEEGLDRDLVIEQLEKRGIPSRAYFTPIHTQPYLKNYEIKGEDHLPVTNKVGKLTMALPFYGDMPREEVDYVARNLLEVVSSFRTQSHKAA